MMTPGKHVVELVSERFNYRATETLDVRPGETTAHTLTLPMGSVRVTAPEGAEIRVDAAPRPAARRPRALSMSIGSHEISATHPSLGNGVPRLTRATAPRRLWYVTTAWG